MSKYFNYLIDKFTGFDLTGGLKNVLKRDSWSRIEIDADQQRKFDTLSEIASNSKFYRNFAGKGLEDFPVMDRKTFKQYSDEIRTNIRSPYSVQHTSGSTGYPVTLAISKEMVLAKRVSHQKMLAWFNMTRESREFKIGGLKQDAKTRLYYFFRNKRYVNSFVIKEDNIERIISKYNRFKPEILYGYPSAIFNFINIASAKKTILHQPRIIVTHAENQYDEYTDLYRKVFPSTKIVNQYWSTEANIAVTCPEGNLHFDEDTIIPEVINVDENGVGDLLITNLYSFDQPLIRYSIGDRVKISGEKCSCGRESRVIEKIEGRQAEEFQLPDGRVITATALYFSRFNQNLLFYQLVYFKSDSIMEFRYIPEDPGKPINNTAIKEYLKNDFGLDTKFTKVESIGYTPGGKFKKVLMAEQNS